MGRVHIKPTWIALGALVVLTGCLGRSEVEKRWTNLEILDTNVHDEEFSLGGTTPVTVCARLSFAEILTGEFVAELRMSDSVNSDMVQLDAQSLPIGTAREVDLILENSVTAGRDSRTVTGYPQLLQDVSFQFDSFDPGGPNSGLFLVLYMGEGEEIETQDGRDSLLITPFPSTEYDILAKGQALGVVPAP